MLTSVRPNAGPVLVKYVCNLISAQVCGHFEGLFDYFLLCWGWCIVHLCRDVERCTAPQFCAVA